MQEERGKGKYVRVTNDTEEDGIGGLLTEYGRQLGVVSMMMMVGVAVVVMLLCRVCLRPISLGEVVITNLDREGGGDGGGAREVGGGKGKGVGEVEDMMMVVGDDKTVVGAKDGEINTYGRKRMSDGGDGGGGGGWTTKHGHGHGYDYCHAPGPGPRRPPEITAVIGSGDCDNDVAIVGARTGRGGVTAAAAPTTRGPQQQRNSRRLAFLTRGSSTDADKAAQQTIGMVVGAGSTMAYSYNSDDND